MLRIEFNIDKIAATRAGRDQFGSVIVEVRPSDLTEREREIVAELMGGKRRAFSVSSRADFALPYFSGHSADSSGCKWAEATLETVREALEDAVEVMIKAEAREKAEAENKAARELRYDEEREAQVLMVLAHGVNGQIKKPKDPDRTWSMTFQPSTRIDPRIAALRQEAEKLVEEHNRPIYAEGNRKEAQERAEKAASAERAEAQRALWLEVHGDKSQKERAKRNLLSLDELTDAMRSFYLAPLDRFAKFEKITAAEVRTFNNCEGRVTFHSADATSVAAEEFETLRAIEKLAETIDGTVTAKVVHHSGWIDNDESEVVARNSIRVEAQIGEIVFSRLYACP